MPFFLPEYLVDRSRGRLRAIMPDTPVAFHLPGACVKCGQAATVHLQQTIHGHQIVLEWHCSACDAEWPVTRKEEEPAIR